VDNLVDAGYIKPLTRDKYFDHTVSGAAIVATTMLICMNIFMIEYNIAALISMGLLLVIAVGWELLTSKPADGSTLQGRFIKIKTRMNLDDIFFTMLGGALPLLAYVIFDMIF
jgi:hypothetical protein